MKCNLLVCAQSVIIDRHTNQVSVINLYERASSSIFPFPFPLIVLAICEKGNLEPKTAGAKVIFEIAGQKVIEHSFQFLFSNNNISKVTINLQGLTIPLPGLLELSMFLEDTVAGRYSILITKNE